MLTHQIVVCDDEPHIVRAISMKLTRAGFDVMGTSDVESCWRLLQRGHSPALLIVDETMPSGPSGLELVRRIRGDMELSELPVVLLTTNNLDLIEQRDSYSDLNIAQVVAKPFSPRALLSLVGRILHSEFQMQATSCSGC